MNCTVWYKSKERKKERNVVFFELPNSPKNGNFLIKILGKVKFY
jgi:hypothetical protein